MKKTFHTPSGGTYTREVAVKSKTKAKAKSKAKAPARTKITAGQEVHHKAYSFKNKKGNIVNVAAHTEYPRGGRPAGTKKAASKKAAPKKTKKGKSKKQKTALVTLK